MRSPFGQTLARYAAAVLAVYIGMELLTLPVFHQADGTPMLLAIFVILVAAGYGGLGPGLLATAIIVVITWPPEFPPARVVRLGMFVGCGATTSVLIEALHRARVRAEGSAEILRRIIESITDHAIFTTDGEGVVRSWSPGAERLLGYAAPDVLGRNAGMLLAVGDLRHALPSRGGYFTGDLSCVRKDGTEFWASAAITPLGKGEAGGCTWVLRDVTERKSAEARLREAKRSAEDANLAKDRFLAVLSHELRTPLAPALVSVSALIDDPGTPPSSRPILEIVRRNIELEARLVDDLLDVTRIAQGKLRLARETVDAHELIRRAAEICREDVAAAGLRLELDLRAAEHHVLADPARLQQAVWNLLKNAVKFTPERGVIWVRSENQPPLGQGSPRLFVVEVRDTGIGIAPQVLPKIFQAFEQGEPGITQRFGGLGLGLAISRGFVEALGGRISAASGGLGEGATFRIELPLVARPATVGASPGEPEEEPVENPLAILLVEDNADTLRAVTHLLGRRGHKVTPAASFDSASAALASDKPFDLVISDIGLPDGSGLDLMRLVRSRSRAKGIALSGYGTEEDHRKSREAGFAIHLTKPVDFPTLEATIRRVMRPGL